MQPQSHFFLVCFIFFSALPRCVALAQSSLPAHSTTTTAAPELSPFSTSSITFRLMAAEIRPMSMKFAASDCRLRSISSSQLVQAAAFAQ